MAAIDTARIEAAVAEILEAIGEQTDRAGLLQTPSRVAQAYAEFFAGVGEDPLQHLGDAVDLQLAENERSELVLVRGIEFRSVCEHHLLPFTGVAHLAYRPRRTVVGLGKLPAVVATLASRPQVQERLTEEIADALQQGLDPLGVLVVLDASHGCVTARGSNQRGSTTVTMATRGEFAEPAQRAELMALIGAGS
ncbi:GTP cyclohydrolase I FolE [Galbitalea soli]|uniref:GTP cyclohydrolase 1 n=1 Tax=Galbitalea soli TaxID=1268042 RepID=A0A7C9PNY8_9MICO|nr:GTP cyclohydrolase I FolE [Galbitalea soli]NEM91992.1 GTP cyclohydrolase I FolE [Galbitalea soli]NYJ32058.1 GTP cyclohydrolase I [Galbitalea soli]